MASEIQTVKTNLHETKEEADEQREKERRRNNIIIYKYQRELQKGQTEGSKMTYRSVSDSSTMCSKLAFPTKTLLVYSV